MPKKKRWFSPETTMEWRAGSVPFPGTRDSYIFCKVYCKTKMQDLLFKKQEQSHFFLLLSTCHGGYLPFTVQNPQTGK